MQNLSHKEQILLERLSVFAGRFLREAAAAVCAGEGIEQNELGNLLAQLVEKSLIIPEAQDEAVRYWLPEAVKQEARACLATNEAVNIFQQRHAAYYVTLAEQTRRKMFGPGRRAWLDRLEQEHHDLEAALYWLADSGQVEQGLRLAVGLREFWLGAII